MWFNLASAVLLYGVLSTTIVVAEQSPPATPSGAPIPSPTLLSGATEAPGGESGTSGVTSPTSTSLPKGTTENNTGLNDKGHQGGWSSESPTQGPASSSPAPVSSGKKSSSTGAIAGGVVGGVLFLVLVGALIFFLRKRKKARDPFGSMEKSGESSSTLSQSLLVY